MKGYHACDATSKGGRAMTPEERQELRDWSARLKRWRFLPCEEPMFSISKSHGFYEDKQEQFIMWSRDWTPDLPSAPAWQILSVIERMRELGWWLFWNNEENKAEFYSKSGDSVCRVTDHDPLLAILLAAKATGVE